MSSKFEQLLDYLVNEEQDKANELFHEIVVEKSREIYENLIAEEEEDEEDESMDESSEDEEDECMDESSEDEENETVESMFGEEEEEDEDFPVQDQTDDFEDDVEDHDAMDADGMGGDDEFGVDGMDDDGGEPATKGDIQDLEDALDELKAEFEKLMAGEEAEEHDHPGIHDVGGPDMGDDDFGDEEDEGDMFGDEDEGDEEDEGEDESMYRESRAARSQGERMREYIEKVSANMDGGLVGARSGETMSAPKAGKSPISSGSGKPTSGANAKNITQAGKGEDQDGTSPKGKVGGLVKSGGSFVPAGTKNVAASAGAKKPDGAKLSGVSKPSNKEFAGVGAKTGGDKAGQTGTGETKSPLSGAPNRAK